MPLTFKEVCEKLEQLDEITILEVLDVSSIELVAKFEDKIEDNIEDKKYYLSNDGPFWYDILAGHEELENHAKSGTGPYYSFNLFHKYYKNNVIKKRDNRRFFII